MTKDDFEKLASVVPMAGVVDAYMSQLRNALEDAKNQAENGSQLGMATAVGRASSVFDDLFNAWLSIKE